MCLCNFDLYDIHILILYLILSYLSIFYDILVSSDFYSFYCSTQHGFISLAVMMDRISGVELKLVLIPVSEFKFDGFSADTCRSMVAMMDVSFMNRPDS